MQSFISLTLYVFLAMWVETKAKMTNCEKQLLQIVFLSFLQHLHILTIGTLL